MNDSQCHSHPGLVVYEYLITLEREVQLFWKGKWTGAAVLFYFNRYLSLFVNIYAMVLTDDAQISVEVRPAA